MPRHVKKRKSSSGWSVMMYAMVVKIKEQATMIGMSAMFSAR